MKIKEIDGEFVVCKTKDYSLVNLESPFCFLAKTDEENSLVCPIEDVPENVLEKEEGWKAFRIEGILDFSLIGILAKVAGLLAEEKIPVFVISSFNTDYILVKEQNYEKSIHILQEAGYEIM